MKRRDFLKLAAAGVPAFNIGSLLAAPLAKRIAQGGKIRVALIGCGAQMTGLIRRMGGDQNVQVVALVDPLPSGIRPHWPAVDQNGSGPPVERAPSSSSDKANSFILSPY